MTPQVRSRPPIFPLIIAALASASALAVLAACQPSQNPVLPAGGPLAYAGSCPAADLGALVGASESTAHGLTYQGPIRIIHPGDAVTKDYRPTRLNVEIDAGGRISRLSCG